MSIELKKRILTSLVLLSIFLCCLIINNYLWALLLITISTICGYEFFKITKKIWKNKKKIIFINIFSSIYLLFFIYIGFNVKIFLGIEGILLILLVCVFSDIGGYFVGKNIGGKKLTKLSPNKTVSGTIGSFIFSLIPLIFVNISQYSNNVKLLFLFCFVTSLSCQLGDLLISYFKRRAKLKDTGSILPGHGGLLDRVDGILFGVSVGFLYLTNFVI